MRPITLLAFAALALLGLLSLLTPLSAPNATEAHSAAAQADRVRAGMATGVLEILDRHPAQRLPVRVARTASQRAVGYQYWAREDARPMWFIFPQPTRSSWHMRNVRFALDIAFVDAEGRVIETRRMEPETSGHEAPAPISAALEVPAGELAKLGIRRGTRLRLHSEEAPGDRADSDAQGEHTDD